MTSNTRLALKLGLAATLITLGVGLFTGWPVWATVLLALFAALEATALYLGRTKTKNTATNRR